MQPPYLDDEELEVWGAFWDLNNRSRTATQAGPQGLSVVEITTWLDTHGVMDHFNRLWFYKLIAAMDNMYLVTVHEQLQGKVSTPHPASSQSP